MNSANVTSASSEPQPARIQVFWQPGCSSCLRVKEFLTSQGIDFESIDVHNDAAGLERLRQLGARSVPVVALGGRYTLAQSLRDVIKFLDLKTRMMDMLPPEQLVAKLELVLTTAARLCAQFSEEQLRTVFRNRNRTAGALVFHVVRVVQMGLEAARQIELRFESFDDLPPEHWGKEDLIVWANEIDSQLQAWWQNEPDKSLSYDVPTYYGRRSMHEVLERTAWHSAQHTRQLALILESYGIEPDEPLDASGLAGLPVPEEVWDR